MARNPDRKGLMALRIAAQGNSRGPAARGSARGPDVLAVGQFDADCAESVEMVVPGRHAFSAWWGLGGGQAAAADPATDQSSPKETET